MTLFLAIFYISLTLAMLLLFTSKSDIRKPNTEKQSPESSQRWFIFNLHSAESTVTRWWKTRIRPFVVSYSLTGLKIVQNRLQSMRRVLRNTIIKLSEIDTKNGRDHNNHKLAS